MSPGRLNSAALYEKTKKPIKVGSSREMNKENTDLSTL